MILVEAVDLNPRLGLGTCKIGVKEGAHSNVMTQQRAAVGERMSRVGWRMWR